MKSLLNFAMPAHALHNTKSAPARTLFNARTHYGQVCIFRLSATTTTMTNNYECRQDTHMHTHTKYILGFCLFRLVPSQQSIDRISSIIYRLDFVGQQQKHLFLATLSWPNVMEPVRVIICCRLGFCGCRACVRV